MVRRSCLISLGGPHGSKLKSMSHALRPEELIQRGLSAEVAATWINDIAQLLPDNADEFHAPDPAQMAACWEQLTRAKLSPQIPFDIHAYLFQSVCSRWPHDRLGPPPAWRPGAQELEHTQIARLMREQCVASIEQLHAWSCAEPEAFWGWALKALGIRYHAPPRRVLDISLGPEHAQWLPDAQLNIVESCFQAPREANALVWQTPGQALTALTYGQLRAQTARVAAALRARGFAPGDGLAIDLPMIPQSVSIYLGIVAAGMVVVSIADSMAPDEIQTRLRITGAKGMFTVFDIQRGGKQLPLYEKVLQADPPLAVVLGAPEDPAALRAGDITWEAFLGAVPHDVELNCVASEAEQPTNVLFSSGTTGEPKAIPWTQLTPIKAATDAMLALDVQSGDVVAWPTNLGWMMGPWLVYAALLNQATIALYVDAPTNKDFGRFVQDAGVTVLGLVPSIVKAWRTDDRMVGFDWSKLKCFGSTGEASNAEDYLYLMMLGGYRPVIEYCGGTEIGGGYITASLVQAASPATFTTPALGSRFVLLDEQGVPTTNGEVFLIPPTLGYSQRLVNRDHHEVYFAGAPSGPAGEILRRHGDQIEQLPGGRFRAHGRVDDTMNLGGIKVSSAEIERVLDVVVGVVRSAAVAVSPSGGGPSLLVIYAVVDPGVLANELLPRLQAAIKTKLNPLFRIADLVILDAMPVTGSNKIMRRQLRASYVPPAGG